MDNLLDKLNVLFYYFSVTIFIKPRHIDAVQRKAGDRA